jgi:Thiamine pyrophosphate-requiring enzymes [acetolactate synthase, pyruvate dehydrogenase (cytochrome), glyoxylate carboligase, phosphonopyruvate decarboxylase]
MRMNGADALLRSLEAEGVEVVFGIPGGAILPTYDAFARGTTIRHVLARHEQGAGHMAEGYARASGRVGVAIATSGPGATNLVTPIADAWMDSTPLVCITGQVRSHLIGTDAFQECDITGITIPIVKHSWLVKDVTSFRTCSRLRSTSPAPAVAARCSSTFRVTFRRPSSTSSIRLRSISPAGGHRDGDTPARSGRLRAESQPPSAPCSMWEAELSTRMPAPSSSSSRSTRGCRS